METRPGVRPDPRGTGTWQVRFRVNGKQYTKAAATEKEANRRMDAIEERKALVKSRKIAIPDGVDIGEWFFTDGRSGFPVEPEKETTGDIATLIADYLEHRRLDVAAGQLSQSSYASDKYRLAAFEKFCDKERAADLVTAIGTANLDAYRTHVVGQLAKGKIAAVSAKHALRTVKALVLWAYDKERLEALPRVLNKYADVALPAPTPQFFATSEIKRLYDAATERVKLYILLGLNCGYTQSDISTLEHAHIDWSRGMIIRARNKTGQPQEHKLWPRTLHLLRRQVTARRESSLALLAEGGQPLVRVAIRDDGTPSKTDAIGHGFDVLKANLNQGRKEDEPEIKLPFKCFRKTGADQLAKHYQDNPFLVDLYLAHAAGGVRKHYARQHYDELHKATDWLATLYGFDSEDSSSSGGSP
jgi:integrase